jgi:hypothetical protein
MFAMVVTMSHRSLPSPMMSAIDYFPFSVPPAAGLGSGLDSADSADGWEKGWTPLGGGPAAQPSGPHRVATAVTGTRPGCGDAVAPDVDPSVDGLIGHSPAERDQSVAFVGAAHQGMLAAAVGQPVLLGVGHLDPLRP